MKTETMNIADGETFTVETISLGEAKRSTGWVQDPGTFLAWSDTANGDAVFIGAGPTLDDAISQARTMLATEGMERASLGGVYLVADEVESAVLAVAEAKDLYALDEALDDLGEVCKEHGRRFDEVIDLDTLPTFGGKEPSDTMLVWSWDRHRLLVQDLDTGGFEIVDREGWKAAA